MSLQLLFLGTGTSAGVPMIGCSCRVCRSTDPRDNRTRPSVLIAYPDPSLDQNNKPTSIKDLDNSVILPSDGRRRFLIDTSSDMRTQVIRHNIHRIDGVLYTHSHADHIFGVDDLRRFNAVMGTPIDVYAETATMATIKKMVPYIFDTALNPNNSFVASLNVKTIAPAEPLELHGAKWTPLRLMHGMLKIVGFRVDFAGQSLAYCTDVSLIPEETFPLLADLDLLVIDGLRFTPHPTHLTIAEALRLIERIKPKHAYLTHMCHDVMHAEVDPTLPPGVKLSYDGLQIDLGT